MPACPFCELIDKGTPPHTVYEDDLFIVIPDKNSLGIGHCMIIPRIHVSKIYELEESIYKELFLLARKLSNILKQLDSVVSVAYVSFGSGLQHAHLHLIPHSNPDTLIHPSKYTVKLSGEELANNTEFIRDFIKKNQLKLL